jgi:hypothetical protein
MDQQFLNSITQNIGAYLPKLIGAFLTLIVGWLIATILSGAANGLLRRLDANNRIREWGGSAFDVQSLAGKIVYYVALLGVWIAVFQVLELSLVSDALKGPFSGVIAYAPRLIGAGALLLGAWLLATILRGLTMKALGSSLARIPGDVSKVSDNASMAKTLGEVVYWLVFLLFLPGILGALQVDALMMPLENLSNKITTFLPNIFAASMLLFAGWLSAKIVRHIVTGALAASGIDKTAGSKFASGTGEDSKLSGFLGYVASILVWIPAVIASLNALNIESLSRPASNMLETLLNAIPHLFAAAALMALAYAIGDLVSELIRRTLAGFGMDRVPEALGFAQGPGSTPFSTIAANIAKAYLLLFSAMEAANLLGFQRFSSIITQVLELSGHVLLGAFIIGVGLWISRFVSQTIERSGAHNSAMLSMLSRVGILFLCTAMGLRQMGLANEIVNLAFGLLLGAAAIAVAIAFGIGGRDIAARELDGWVKSAKRPVE